MTSSGSGVLHDMEALHKNFLMQCLGINKTVPAIVVMSEMCRCPLWIDVLRSVVRLWNRVQARDGADLLKMTMLEGQECLGSDADQGSSWVGDLMRCLSKIDVSVGAGNLLDEAVVIQRAEAMWLSRLRCAEAVDRVRDIPDNVTYLTYLTKIYKSSHISVGFHLIMTSKKGFGTT
jgi:hypothetical protein